MLPDPLICSVTAADGWSSGDLGASEVGSAVLDMDGASQLMINMNGGTLTGRVRGVGNIRYRGDVSTVDLDTVALVRSRSINPQPRQRRTQHARIGTRCLR